VICTEVDFLSPHSNSAFGQNPKPPALAGSIFKLIVTDRFT